MNPFKTFKLVSEQKFQFFHSVKSKIKSIFWLFFFSIVLNDQILEKCDQVLFETVLRRPSGTDLKAP